MADDINVNEVGQHEGGYLVEAVTACFACAGSAYQVAIGTHPRVR